MSLEDLHSGGGAASSLIATLASKLLTSVVAEPSYCPMSDSLPSLGDAVVLQQSLGAHFTTLCVSSCKRETITGTGFTVPQL